jgi:hypothetical protein
MKIEVSIGEIIDKYSILELKQIKINNINKLNEINKEKEILNEYIEYIDNNKFLYNILLYINEQIWNLTDIIVKMEITNTLFAQTADSIFKFNQKRFRIKKKFNDIYNSNLKEQKSYSETKCKIIINNENILINKIPEINYLLIEYDLIYFQTTSDILNKIQTIFNLPNINIDDDISVILNLNDYTIQDDLREIYDFEPIIYISGGLLGDFINALSVINENYYKFGKKGILYIAEIGDKFRTGINTTYNDTYELIINQKYIKEYKIYNNENFHINLSSWRNSDLLYKTSWHNIFKKTYNVEWGMNTWIKLNKDYKWSDKVLISTNSYRKSNSIDYKKLYDKYGDNLIYFSQNIDYYNEFKLRTNLNIEYYKPISFLELCIGINSCKLFCGNLSAPLTIAIACNTKIIIEYSNTIDDIHNKDYKNMCFIDDL